MITQALFHVKAANAEKAESMLDLTTPEVPVVVSYQPTALKLNGTIMGSELEFVKRFEEVMTSRRDKSVLLTASPDLQHGRMVRIMDLVKRHGANNLVMVKWNTEQPS
jgi:biopolymer transport protein ExbD